MNTSFTVLGIALVALVALTGVAAATGGFGGAPVDEQPQTNDTDLGAGDGTGPIHVAEEDRALDGTNSPWVTEDQRLERFQDRFNLTDEQVESIQTEVQSMIENGATQDEIRATVTERLEAFGVEDPTLGPPEDGGGADRPFGHGAGTGGGHGPAGGQADGTGGGPHGPGDGSCQN